MYKYELIIYWSDEDTSYIVEVPELPGCMADGSSYEEAIKNVEIVIKEWIETAETTLKEVIKQKKREKAIRHCGKIDLNLSQSELESYRERKRSFSTA